MRNTHTYKNAEIIPCGCQNHTDYGHYYNSGRWYIQSYHQTGMRMTESECPHYYTLREAKKNINMMTYRDNDTGDIQTYEEISEYYLNPEIKASFDSVDDLINQCYQTIKAGDE